MNKILNFKSFILNESRVLDLIDFDYAEEFFTKLENKPECIPHDIREWTRLKEQISRLVKLNNDVYSEDAEYKEWMEDQELIIKKIIGKDMFKHSLGEILQDAKQIEIKRILDKAGISVPHIESIIDDIIIRGNEINEIKKYKSQEDKILTAQRSKIPMLSKSQIKKVLGKKWSIEETNIEEITGYNSLEEIVKKIPEFGYLKNKQIKYKCYTCHKNSESRSSFQYLDMIVYAGYWESTNYGTDRTTFDYPLTSNDEFNKFIEDARSGNDDEDEEENDD